MRSLATKKLSSKSRKELEELYQKHEWYVTRLAQHIASMSNVSAEDLKQEGFLGIARAKELYNPKISAFLTYAQYWIKVAMYSYAYRSSYVMDIPEEFHALNSKYNKLLQEHNGELSIAEAAQIIGVSENRLSRMKSCVRALRKNIDLSDVDKLRCVDNYVEDYAVDKDVIILSRVKEVLTPEEFFVVCNLLGLDGKSPKTLSWVGKIVGVTKERIRQIRNAALEKIKPLFMELTNVQRKE